MIIKRNTDVILGSILATVNFIYSHINAAIACATGLVILATMIIRLRKEWRHKDD